MKKEQSRGVSNIVGDEDQEAESRKNQETTKCPIKLMGIDAERKVSNLENARLGEHTFFERSPLSGSDL